MPQFVSTPGTAATQDAAYTYQIETAASAGTVTLALASAPSGTALNGNVLTWTPSASQSRVSNSFSITATNSAGSATQSWSITPAGTISGSWIDTFWTSSGPVSIPFDWTAAPGAQGFPIAFVPQSDGSFQMLSGSGNSDGTFSIPNVPGGYYWLEPGLSAYWTSNSTVDLSEDVDAPLPPKASTGPGSTVTTQMQFDLSGLAPIQTGDQVALVWQLPTPFASTWFTDTPLGATTINTYAQVSTNIDFSQGGQALFLQHQPEAIGTLSALELVSEDMLPNLTMTNGTSNSVSATLTQSPQTSFDLNVAGSQWAPLFSGVAPTSPAWLGADLAVTANMFMPQEKLATIQRSSIPLLADARKGPSFTLGLIEGFVYQACPGTSPTFSGTSVLPGESPINTDQDFGLLQYSDPFPSNWQRVFTFCQTASVPIPLPNSSDTVSFNLVDSESTSLPPAHIAPLIGQVQNPTINSKSLFAASTISAAGATLTWAAPAGTTPTGYKIAVFAAGTLPTGTTTTYLVRGFFYTAKTSAVLPGLQPGETYVFVISSILDGAANFETQPNWSALPTASVSVISAPITIVAGP